MSRGTAGNSLVHRISSTAVILVVVWTAICIVYGVWDRHNGEDLLMRSATEMARAHHYKDRVFREWATRHGGVYVPVDDRTPPSPYLSHIPDRDIVTPGGRQLTLMNPAYIIRQFQEEQGDEEGVTGHITSLNPLNPNNAPDDWERASLLSFQNGAEEALQVVADDQGGRLRYMRPMITQQGCLKCHGHQGYQIGDIRGGVGVSVALASFRASEDGRRRAVIMGIAGVWFFGIVGIGFAAWRLLLNARTIHEASAALEQSESRLRSLIDTIPDLVCFKDGDDRWLVTNTAMLSLYGLQGVDYRGKSASDLALEPGCIRGALLSSVTMDEEAWRLGRSSRGDEEVSRAGRDDLIFDTIRVPMFAADGARSSLLVVGRDVTEQRHAAERERHIEEQMRHAQKLESLGVLAGGIAHDFNNLLMAILGNIDLSLMDLSADSPARVNLGDAAKASHKAVELCQQMLAFSGRGSYVIESIDLNAIVEDMASVLRVAMPKKAEFRLELSTEPLPVRVDISQVGQVVMNLITNAADSLEDGSGVIELRTYMVESSLEDMTVCCACLEVRDDGCGMNAEVKKQIFDPFFTTKFTGRGLGLASLVGIVRSHNGEIEVESTEGQGTLMRIMLPIDIEGAVDSRSSTGDETNLTVGSLHVLVVDDEQEVRKIVESMFRWLGCRVTMAENGREGVEIFREGRENIDLVLMDLTMPEMDGREACLAIKNIDPDMPVLLTSGYEEQDVSDLLITYRRTSYIKKPYKLGDLKKAVSMLTVVEKM